MATTTPTASRAQRLAVLRYQRRQILRQAASREYLAFLQYCWWMPTPLILGRHTRAICTRLTRAVDDFLQGRSTFLLIKVPFRHGKTDMVSRAFPPFFLGRCAHLQPDVIMSGYGASLVEGFSRKAQSIIRSQAYRDVFPGVLLNPHHHNAGEWSILNSAGVVTAVGLGGAITGKGGHLITCDDYCKSREEAESQVYRDKTWESFKDNLMTRRAPTSIVVVPATPWHEDDVMGRIEMEMARNPDFPRFEVLTFPATDPTTGEYLFAERMGEDWYREQYATLGPYSAAALLDCNPRPKGEQKFQQDWFRYYESTGLPKELAVDLIVDYAGSKDDEACESAILERLVDSDGNRYFDRLTHGRLGPQLLKQTIVERITSRRAEGRRVRLGLEAGAAIVLRGWLEEEIKANRLSCSVYELKSPAGTGAPRPGEAKLRIEALVAPYHAGMIWHSQSAGSEQVWARDHWFSTTIRGGELERQLLHYPSKPDDCADVAAYSEQGLDPPKEKRDDRKLPFWALPLQKQFEIIERSEERKQRGRRYR